MNPGDALSWSVGREELERWFPGEAARWQASLCRAGRRAFVASVGIGLLLVAGGARWLPGFEPRPVLVTLALAATVPLALCLLPRRLFEPGPLAYSAGRDRLTANRRILPASRIRCVVWGARGSGDAPRVAWLLSRGRAPMAVVFPASVAFESWLLETGPYPEHDTPEPHPLEPPLGIGTRLANLVYLLIVPAAAALAWLSAERFFPGLPPKWALLLLVPLGPGLLVLLGPGRRLVRYDPSLLAALLLFNQLHALCALFLAAAIHIGRLAS